MPIKTKRWNDLQEADDGYRLVICRYRPRGVRKVDEPWDEWCKLLGPSKELHAAYYGKHGQESLAWPEYRERYLQEMAGDEQQELIARLAERVATGETITLLCSSACTDEAHCHRTLLKELIETKAEK